MILPDLAAVGPRASTPVPTAGRAAAAKGDPDEIAATDAPVEEEGPEEVREKDKSRKKSAAKDFEAVLEAGKAGVTPTPPAAAPVPEPAAPAVPVAEIATPVADPVLTVAPPPVVPVPEISAETASDSSVAAVKTVEAGVTGALAAAVEAAVEVAPDAAATPPAGPSASAAKAETPAARTTTPAEVAPEPEPDPGPEGRSVAEPAPADRATAADAAPASDTATDTTGPAKPRDAGIAPSAAAAPEWRLAAQATAPAPRELPPIVHAAPREVTQQITLAVSTASSGTVEIRLDPPELGRVHIHLTPTEQGGLQATVLAERPETHDFLRRHAEALTRDLNAAGYESVSLDFATGGQNTPRDGERLPEARSFTLGGGQVSAAPQAPVPTRAAPSGSLDIRL